MPFVRFNQSGRGWGKKMALRSVFCLCTGAYLWNYLSDNNLIQSWFLFI